MSDVVLAAELAERLAQTDRPIDLLPDVLPFPPLDLLVALHIIVTTQMAGDRGMAWRAARAAELIARRWPDDPLLEAQRCWTAGNAVLHAPDYAGALALYDRALEYYARACERSWPDPPARDVRVVHITRVFCLSELGRYAEALRAVEDSQRWLEQHGSDLARMILILNRSQLAERLCEYQQVIDLADQGLALADQPGARQDQLYRSRSAQLLVNRANACTSLGRFEEAHRDLDRALERAQSIGETLTIGRIHWNRARAMQLQGRLFDALMMLRRAEALMVDAPGEAATIALLEAEILEQIRQLPDARAAAERAAESFAAQLMPAYSATATIHAARLAVEQRNRLRARKLLRRLPALTSEIATPVLIAERDLVAAAAASLGDPERGDQVQRRAWNAARRRALYATDSLRALGLSHAAARAELIVADLHARVGDLAAAERIYDRLVQHGSAEIRLAAHAALGAILSPDRALPNLQRAAELTIAQRRALPMEELQARYSSDTSPHLMRLAAWFVAHDRLDEALHSVWQAKAGPLLDLRAATATLDTDVGAALDALKAEIARWRFQAMEQQRQAGYATTQQQPRAVAYHAAQAEAAEHQIEAAEHALQARLRSLGPRSGRADVPDVPSIRLLLGSGCAVLEFAQLGDRLVSLLLTPETPVRLHDHGTMRELAVHCERWAVVCQRLLVSGWVADPADQIRRVLRPLWDRLLAPWQALLGEVRDLIIAPCGVLNNLPWAAIYQAGDHDGAPTLALAPSGGLLGPAAAVSSPRSARLLGYAATGDLFLEHVKDELTAVARSVGSAHVSHNATAADLRGSSAPDVLHIAAHARTDARAPLNSSIDLADGSFRLLEAHRLDLRGTRLVALSGCETGVCPDQGGVTLALAGAFLSAGAQAVLASLWRISDQAAALLMRRFYQAYSDGSSAALALAQAQQTLREQHPLDWAAFQIWTSTPAT